VQQALLAEIRIAPEQCLRHPAATLLCTLTRTRHLAVVIEAHNHRYGQAV
jgi:hypothetical protein